MTTTTQSPVGRHDIPGVYNLRDTGGYRAAGGASRARTLYRSDAPHRLDDAGRARLAELGITRALDLRGEAEQRAAPSLLGAVGIEIVSLPVFDEADPASVHRGTQGLAPVYDLMVDERGHRLADAVRIVSRTPRGEAVLVHCTAGKDRTGLVVAFALLAAGVDRVEAVADYAQTEDNLRGEWADGMLALVTSHGEEPTPAIVELMTASPAPMLEALLDRIDAEFGSIHGYLLAHGLTDADLRRLRTTLIA